MKKMFVLVLLALLAINCFATGETYATAGDLFQSWAENYPDYICGVWSTDGGMNNLTFSVMNNEDGEKGKEEILALVEDDSTVTFEYGVVSRNYLTQVQEELLPYFEKDLGLLSSAVYEMQNRIELGIMIDRAEDPDTLAMLEELKEKYGNIFIIAYTDEAFDTLEAQMSSQTVQTKKCSNTVWYIVFGIIILVLTAVIVALLRKKRSTDK